ncbi:DNA glycosylase [Anaeromyces robustus]|uniref:DNA glycosylase n=1 Tax=Anaeromyces robustus TaxID=1754192 RepID=A0A1Y1WJF1_9FUNG|nr:DNA glycosylase [Anaeromyces robustus]|eukprot:ORX73458.1 DNA glycosylase [Anaeromyces robustus]
MSWNDFFIKNSKLVNHIYNQLKTTNYTPPIENIFGIFKHMSLEEVKVVMIGDQPYQSASDVCDIAFGTNNPETPSLLKHIFENMEKTVASFNRPMTNHLDRWLKDGIFLCNFCFTRPTYGSTPPHYHLLWEPFTNNLVQYISNHHSVIFILFGSRAKSLRKSINEIKSVVIEAPHPIYNYKEFKNSNCFRKAREYAGNIGFILNW